MAKNPDRAVVSVDIGWELREWLESDKSASMSEHVRAALELYREQDLEQLQVALREKRKLVKQLEPIAPNVIRLGEWLDDLSEETRAFVIWLGRSLERRNGLESFTRKAPSKSSKKGSARKPRGRATR